MSRQRMIGPAISCGKSRMYSANRGTFCSGCALRLYTSTTYEIAWNVKKEMPSGKGIAATANGVTCQHGRQYIDIGDREIRVLEDRQREEIAGNRDRKPTPADARIGGAADRMAEEPVACDRAHD